MSGLGVLLSKYNHSLFLSTLHKVAGARNKGSDQKKARTRGRIKKSSYTARAAPRESRRRPEREDRGGPLAKVRGGRPRGRDERACVDVGIGEGTRGASPSLAEDAAGAGPPVPRAARGRLPASPPLPPGTQAALTWAPPPGTGGQWEEEGDTSKSLSSSASPTVLGKLQGPGGGHGCSMSRWPGPDNRHRQPPRRE